MSRFWKITVVLMLTGTALAVLILKNEIAERAAEGQPAASQPVVGLPRLLDLGAKTCIPCKMMAPILEEMKKEYDGRLEVEFIDVWENAGAGRQHKINLIPTQIFFDGSGKELWRHEGFISKDDILAKFKELGIDIASEQPTD